jgi:hypothetical protein
MSARVVGSESPMNDAKMLGDVSVAIRGILTEKKLFKEEGESCGAESATVYIYALASHCFSDTALVTSAWMYSGLERSFESER